MKILIISDTHDNIPNFKKVVGWALENGVEVLIHSGDVCSINIWDKALKGFTGKRFLSLGNADKGRGWEKRIAENVLPEEKVFLSAGNCRLGGKRIAFCHFRKEARELAESNTYNIVFYGHTHKPWAEKIGKCELVNPGNLAGISYRPTFAIYDTNTNALSLKILDRLI